MENKLNDLKPLYSRKKIFALQKKLKKMFLPWKVNLTLGTRGFSRVRREFSVLAEGRHVFGRRPKPREKPLARSGAFYRSR